MKLELEVMHHSQFCADVEDLREGRLKDLITARDLISSASVETML